MFSIYKNHAIMITVQVQGKVTEEEEKDDTHVFDKA